MSWPTGKPANNALQFDSGTRYGRLTVQGPSNLKIKKFTVWRCVCDCGNVVDIRGVSLKRGNTQSCGCLQRDRASQVALRHGHAIHGMESQTYNAWRAMLSRCTNDRDIGFHRYGGRGIGVCGRWTHSFENFLADMGPKPPGGYFLERVENSMGYHPDNCVWATKHQQARNTRRNRFIEFAGKRLCLTDWATECGISEQTLSKRLKRGWTLHRALSGIQP